MNYTKGEWTSTRTSDGILIHTPRADEEDIALVYDQSNDSEEANARLIAQSPRMAKLLARLVKFNQDDGSYDELNLILEDAKQIIAKVEEKC